VVFHLAGPIRSPRPKLVPGGKADEPGGPATVGVAAASIESVVTGGEVAIGGGSPVGAGCCVMGTIESPNRLNSAPGGANLPFAERVVVGGSYPGSSLKLASGDGHGAAVPSG